jgi:transposase InsO family protein
MRAEGLRARARKRFRSTTMSEHDQPVATNVLNRRFDAEHPNQRWVGDTTEFVIGSSAKLYLAAILDLYSRFVVGWAVSAVNDRHLTLRALDMALKRRCPEAGLLHHSDQGCTYAMFYNQRRRHSTLGQISPAEFEKRATRRVDPVENRQERGFPPAPHASSLLSGEERRTKDGQLTQPSTESDQPQI